MSKYIAKFNGGPAHGEEVDCPTCHDVYTLTKVYETGLVTRCKYLLSKKKDNVLHYDLMEERFVDFNSSTFRENKS